jgi:transposase
MRTAPREVRRKAVAEYRTGRYTQKALADAYGVHARTIANWIRIAEREHRYTSLPRGHRPASFTEEDKRLLAGVIAEHPDFTLRQLREMMDKKCSLQTIRNTLVRLGVKKRYALVNRREEPGHENAGGGKDDEIYL